MSAKLAGNTVGLVAARITICLAITLTGLAPSYAGEPEPTGNWKVSDGTSHIRIAECNGVMWGVLSWERVPGLDTNNKDASKRTRPTFGMPVILGMKKAPGADHWEGQVYNAKNGKTYKSTMKLLSPDQLEVKGCVLFFCGGDTWTRVTTPVAGGPVTGQPGGTVSQQPVDFTGDICTVPDIKSSVQ